MSEPFKNRLRNRIESAFNRTGKPEIFSFEWGLERIADFYKSVVRGRFRMYEKDVFKHRRLPCYVISVGNIAVGGTGKTPMTIYLAELLAEMGKKTVVLSRGYKGTYRSESLVVSDGSTVFSEAEVCGDEPFMMAMRKKFPVVVGKDRYKAGRMAVKEFNPDIVILDDGFQHLKLHRDLDLLLLDGTHPFGNRKLLPAGRLREPVYTAADRAGALIFTRCRELKFPKSGEKEQHREAGHPSNRENFQLLSLFEGIPSFRTFHKPYISAPGVSNGDGMQEVPDAGEIKGARILLFSGVADNRAVHQSVESFGVNIVEHLEFQDHYGYKESDFEAINRTALSKDVRFIVTTEKDWVKARLFKNWSTALLVAGVRIVFEEPDAFQGFMEKKIS